jgi:peroxiredoxin Q/BCP
MSLKILSFLFCLLISFSAFGAEEAKSAIPQAGTLAPDFDLPSSKGEIIKLSQYRGKNTVVLYFYPRDNTPGCTLEAQKFSEDLGKYEKQGAVVLGVSVDDLHSHKAFVGKYGKKTDKKPQQEITIPLLSDVGGKVAKAYGVMGWIMANRVTFVIDKEGKVAKVFEDVKVEDHSKEVFKEVEKLAGASK